jgi:hypothetical protein
VKQTERLDLINRIGREVQSRMTYQDIGIYFKGFGINKTPNQLVNSKWIYAKEFLEDASDELICTVADDLEIKHDYVITDRKKAVDQITVLKNEEFIQKELILELRKINSDKFDTRKLCRFCEELNDSYIRQNYLSSALLIRAVMNHIPPIFGFDSFSEVVSSSSKSVKQILSQLEQNSRPIADLHTHALISKSEQLPSKNQIEPYKSSFEILIQEIVKKLLI